jgi:cytochrome c-type biogenesis protein
VPGALIALAVAAGAAAATNPCGVGLLPGYVVVLVAAGARRPAWRLAAEGLAVGAGMTLGLVALYLAVAAAFGAVAGVLGARLPAAGLAAAGLTAAWGAAILWRPDTFLLHLPLPAGTAGGRGAAGAVAYGAVYGLASLGCTFPLFFSLVVQAGAAGTAPAGVLVVLAYALGMGAVVTALAVAARLARSVADGWVRRAARLSSAITGLVVLGSGLFVAAYWLGIVA